MGKLVSARARVRHAHAHNEKKGAPFGRIFVKLGI